MTHWIYRLDVSDIFDLVQDSNYDLWRDEIVRRIRESRFFQPEDYRLEFIVENLERADNTDEFDVVWAYFYNYADERRILVNAGA